MKVGIIGAGMAGLSCADVLKAQGHSVRLFDKGRGPGGRMSSRRMDTPLGEASFDHGAQYFTARDPGFRALVAEWEQQDLAQPWPDSRKEAWVGVPAMSAVIKAMAAHHDVTFGCLVKGLARAEQGWNVLSESAIEGPFDQIVIAVPAEQAAPLLAMHDLAMASIAMRARSQPCWTAMMAFHRPLQIDDDVIIDMGNIAWAACNSTKPGRTGPEAWVIQATAQWSAANLELSPQEVLPLLIEAFDLATPCALPAPITSVAHRWRFALSAGLGIGPLWNADLGLGVCGDWFLGPRVESAWLSGKALADAMCSQDQTKPTLAIDTMSISSQGHALNES